MSSHNTKLHRVVQAPSCEIVALNFQRGYEHRRQDCPYLQTWLHLGGTWTDRYSSQPSRPGEFLAFEPRQSAHRICEEPSLSIGIRFKHEGLESQQMDNKVLWRLALNLVKGHKDPDTFEEILASAAKPEPLRGKVGKNHWIWEIVNLICQDPSSRWTLKDYANFACVHPHHLSHEFSRAVGMPLTRFRNQQRLLCNQQRQAIFDGFYDESHRNKACLSAWGISSAELRSILTWRP